MLRHNLLPITLASVCGVATAVAVFQPELQQQQEERQGTFQAQHAPAVSEERRTVISDAIMSDLKEAANTVKKADKGFAWGIREALFSSKAPEEKSVSSEKSVEARDGTSTKT